MTTIYSIGKILKDLPSFDLLDIEDMINRLTSNSKWSIDIPGELKCFPPPVDIYNHQSHLNLLATYIGEDSQSPRRLIFSSTVDHHFFQNFDFINDVLPAIISRKIKQNNKTIRLATIDSDFGEKAATILGLIILAFESEKHKNWGNIKDWKIIFNVIESDEKKLREIIERLSGRIPLLVEKNFMRNDEWAFYRPDYEKRVTEIISALNRHRNFVNDSFLFCLEKSGSKEVVQLLSEHDLIFMNYDDSNYELKLLRKIGKLYSKYCITMIFMGTSKTLFYIRTHILVNGIETKKFRLTFEMPYKIAVPVFYFARWIKETS